MMYGQNMLLIIGIHHRVLCPLTNFDICYVVDTSGSMAETGIQTTIEAVDSFNNAMYNNDRAAIVGFDSSATTYSRFTSDQMALENALHSLRADGNTNVNAGLIRSMDLYDSETSYNKIVMKLLCDGNVNYTNATLQRAIKNKHKTIANKCRQLRNSIYHLNFLW